MIQTPRTLSPRVYGVVLAGRLECPKCGHIMTWAEPPRRHGKVVRWNDPHWNPLASVVTCGECGQHYQLGLLVWPMTPGEARTARMPRDQMLTPAQIVRARAGGFLSTQARTNEQGKVDPAAEVTKYVSEGCTCGDLAIRPDCAVHGI